MSGAACTSRASIGRRPRQARHSSDRNRRRCSCRHPLETRGVLLSAADGQLQARPFDAAALRLVGDPRTLPVAAGANTPYHSAMLSASADLLATVAIADRVRRATGHRRARRDGRANVRAPATELAAPVPGREADGAADRSIRFGAIPTSGSRTFTTAASSASPRPPVPISSRCGLRMGGGWHTDPAP